MASLWQTPDELLAGMRNWQKAEHPEAALKSRLKNIHSPALNAIMSTFMMYQFNLPLELRSAAVINP